MSVDTHGHTEHGHHEPVEVVDRRQRMAVWLFIGGDIVTLSAMLFTYLYLRGTNTGGHWMSMLGYDQSHSADYYMNAASLPDPKLIHIHPMSASFSWLVAAVVVVSALILWGGEKTLRAGSQRASQFSATSPASTTFHPYARNLPATLSLQVRSVEPSIVMWLSSKMHTRRSRPRCPASEAAS